MSSQPANNLPSFGHTMGTGLLVIGLVLFSKWCIEHHSLYRSLQSGSYSWLQSRLKPPINRDELPVVIVDIHELIPPVEKEVNGTKFTLTPRKELLELITKVADQGPAVIGVDIDFSPNRTGYLDQDNDQVFFRALMEISKHKVPIFLGIRRSQSKPTEKWLGATEFKSLAASVWVPPNDNRKMLAWLDIVDESRKESMRGRSMCSALAQTFTKREHLENPGWIISRYSEEEITPNLKAGAFLVDFSPVKLMMDLRLTPRHLTTVSDLGWGLNKKIVLIGDGVTNDSRDTFPVPDSNYPRGIPGIFKHAAGTYTLVKAPLYEMTTLGRIVADFILAITVLASVAFVRRIVTRHPDSRFNEHTAINLFTALVTVVVLVVGVTFVHLTRVMWDDFLFVILALWLHGPIAKIMYSCWVGAKKLPKLIKAIFSEMEGSKAP